MERKPFTRRGLLSMINQVYDVLGIIQPFILPGRKMLQQACQDKIEWDEPITGASCQTWDSWVEGLQNLDKVSIPRSFKLPVCSALYGIACIL